MYTDPEVVRRKVDREIDEFRDQISNYRARGIWILEYNFPELLVAFATPTFKPHALVPYAVLLDLRNYDVEPPSIRFVNPFTRKPLLRSEIPTNLQRVRVNRDVVPTSDVVPVPDQNGPVNQILLQAWTMDDDRPFVCLQGVREYHENPGHSSDSWWFHRSKGAGSISRLLGLISKYGTEAMREFQMQLRMEVANVASQPPTEVV